MSEWWTYRLSDFLMFSPQVYWRLVERYNREAWPLHLLMLVAGSLLLWLAATRPAAAARPVAGALAVVWLWVGWSFHHQTYAQINWAAEYAAIAFAIQAVLLAGLGVVHPPDAAASTCPRLDALAWRWPQLESFSIHGSGFWPDGHGIRPRCSA